MTDQQEMVLHLQHSVMIKIWCEYNICGNFGGNNNEEICTIIFPTCMISEDYHAHINTMVMKYIKSQTDFDDDELEGLYGWEIITPVVL